MNRIILIAVAASVLLGAHVRKACAQEFGDVVTITLLATASIEEPIVTLGKVATLKGGPASLRYKIAKLDLIEMKLGEARRTIALEQVRFRLLLAGVDEGRFRLTGAKTVTLHESAEPLSGRQILQAAESVLRQAYSLNAGNTTFTVVGHPVVPSLALEPEDRVRLEAKLAEPAPASGLVKVNVSIIVNQRVHDVATVQFDVTSTGAAPKRFDANVQQTSLSASPAKDLRTVLIKARDSVKIVAILGSARIEATGEALQEGRAGEVIRVRNLESNRIVHGRVEEGGAVVVEY
jgi:hypothetical protein